MFNTKIASITLWVLMAVALVVLILFFVGGTTPETAGLALSEPKFTTLALQLAYVYFAIAVLLTIGFPLIGIFTHPKGTGGFLIAGLVFIGIFVISFLLASNEPIPGVVNPANIPGPIKWVDTGLIACYFFLFLAFLGIIYSELSGIFRK